MKIKHAVGNKYILLCTKEDRLFARGDDVEISFCSNGYQSTSVGLPPEMMMLLQNVLDEYKTSENINS